MVLSEARRLVACRCLAFILVGVWLALGLGCHQMPAVPFPASKKEARLGEDYVGKAFVTVEDAFLYPGLSPWLSKRPPESAYDRPVPVPAGTRFVVRNLELNHGVVGNSLLGIAMLPGGGGEFIGESADTLFVDLYLATGVRRNVRLEKDLGLEGRPMFRPAGS